MFYLLFYNATDPYDPIIGLLFTFFAASMVNERIIDFIKLRFPSLWLKSFNQQEEFERHKRLWLLAFLMGLSTASLLNINLLDQLRVNYQGNKLLDAIGQSKYLASNWLQLPLNCVFTALFISLGSKFWHDLLDLVLFVKNSQRKLNHFEPTSITTIEQVDKFLKEDEYAIAQKALEANRKELEKRYKDASFNIGYEFVDGAYRWAVMVFHQVFTPNIQLSKKDKISYTTNYGYIFNFPVCQYVTGEVAIAQGTVSMASGGLANQNSPNIMGTFGCIVKDLKTGCKDYLLLTCYHCVRLNDVHTWEDGINENSTQRNVLYRPKGKDSTAYPIGEVIYAYRNGKMDIALIKAISNKAVTDYILRATQTVPIGRRIVTNKDIEQKTRIWFSGATSGNCEAFIVSAGHATMINYGTSANPELHKLRNLIVFSQNQYNPYARPCEKGDSGTVIMDAVTKEALGMVVARDDNFGYAIPMEDILTEHSLSLFTDPCEI